MRWTGRKQVTSGPVDHGKEFGFFFLMKLLKICYTRYYLQGIQTLTEETDIQRNNDPNLPKVDENINLHIKED